MAEVEESDISSAYSELNIGLCPVKFLAFDAMNTLFEAKGSRSAMNALVLAEEFLHFGGINIEIKPEELAGRIRSERAKYDRKTLGETDYWVRINTALVRSYAHHLDEEQAQQIALKIHERILGDPNIYEVRDDMRQLLHDIKQHCPSPQLLIASNQKFENVWNFVRYFQLELFFPRHWIFTSDILGAHKPQQEFFVRLKRSVVFTLAWEAMQEVTQTYARWADSPLHRLALENLDLWSEDVLQACRERSSPEGQERLLRERIEMAISTDK